IDCSRPNRSIWKYLEKAIPDYQATMFSMAAFTRPLPCPMFLIPPAIDPLSDKNCALSEEERIETVRKLGVDTDRPLLLQVSRFDRFKDPLGVSAAYRLVKPYHPGLQLVLAGGPASDDPEGAEVLREVIDRAGEDPDLRILLLPPDSHRAINALQRSALIVLQKSVKEGFGLTVTEALWKGKPVIGGACGGITLQVHDYHTGFLVHSPEGAAYRIRYLLRYADKRQRMGRIGHEFVREPFIHVYDGEEIRWMKPASGLTTALDPVMQACSGVWVAHGSGDADREASDERGRVSVPPENPTYTLRRVWLSKQEQQGYYYGFANEGLWPLCHVAYTRPHFDPRDWDQYYRVNRKFADAVLDEVDDEPAVVFVQDYHFALLPRMLRDARPDLVILHFWHIPWPNREVF